MTGHWQIGGRYQLQATDAVYTLRAIVGGRFAFYNLQEDVTFHCNEEDARSYFEPVKVSPRVFETYRVASC